MKTVFRVQPIERGGVHGISNHNSRAVDAEHIDPERSHLNFFLRGDEKIETALREVIRDVPMARGCKDKSKENVAAEFVMSASPEFFENGGDVQAWAKKSLEWIDKQFPGRCISCVVHMDEETPHLHAILRVDVEKARVHPTTKELMQAKRVLSYSDFFVDRKEVLTKARLLGTSHLDTKLGRLQTSYAEAVSVFGLQRGECSARSKRNVQHLTPAEFRAREKALEEQAAILEQTKKARADLASIQKGVAGARSEKSALEKEAAALSAKVEERQKWMGEVGAALEAKKLELAAAEKMIAEYQAKAAGIKESAKAVHAEEIKAAQSQLVNLKNEGEKARAALDVLRADISNAEMRAAVIREDVAELEKKVSEKKGEFSKVEKLTGEMFAKYEKTKNAAEAWGKEAEKFKGIVVEKTPLPVWSILCKQAGSAAVAADFVKSLPENVARGIAKTADAETQKKLEQEIHAVHAPARRSQGMSMGR